MNKCQVEWCIKPVHGNGYCQTHYNQIRKHGKILENERSNNTKIIYCEICNVSNYETRVNHRKRFDMTLCEKHNAQMKSHGRILDSTFLDENEYVLYDNYAEIILCNYNCEELARAIIDIEDVDKCKQHKWCLTTNNYVISNVNGDMIKLHRLILDVLDKSNVVIDHIDRNPLNNRKNNLRICSQLNNSQYKGIQSNNTSGIIGVNYDKRNNKWRAYITINKKQKFLGYYMSIEDALINRLKAEKEYFGEFAPQQNLFQSYDI